MVIILPLSYSLLKLLQNFQTIQNNVIPIFGGWDYPKMYYKES